MRKTAWLASLAVVITIAAGGCAVTQSSSEMTVQEVTDALARSKGDVAKPSPNNKLSIPADLSRGLTLTSSTGKQLSVNLPIPQGKPHKMANGTVLYTEEHSGGAVIPTKEGAQLLTVIRGAGAREEYVYTVNGGSFQLSADGGAVVLNDSGKMQYIIAKPWAKDANGIDIPTKFRVEVNGALLVQDINHVGAAYPVTADPRWIERQWWGTVIHFTNDETRQIARGSQFLAIVLGWSPVVAVAVGVFSWWMQGIADSGRCTAAVMNTAIFWEERC